MDKQFRGEGAMSGPLLTGLGASTASEKRIPSIDRAIDLLELLATSGRVSTISHISQTLRIPKSSTHYLVHTLLSRGYLERTPDGRDYFLGSRLLRILGEGNFGRLELRSVCGPHLCTLAQKLGLTAHAAVMEENEGIIIFKADGYRKVATGYHMVRHFDLHCTALGKALIMHNSEAGIEKLFRVRGMAKHNLRTITSLATLKEDLAKVREKGYAVNDEEHTVGIRAIGAPVINSMGEIVAAISVHGPTNSLPTERVPMIGNEILRTAREISTHF
jgi:DNA-binding IclR family transcriptional regulator